MNQKKLELMREGGRNLSEIKKKLIAALVVGATPLEIDALADRLIAKYGDLPSFKTVKGYHHATCINVNEGVVHGLPNTHPFRPGDLVTVDLGLVHRGWHLDTSLTIPLPPVTPAITRFLEVGQIALQMALKEALPGHTVYQIGVAMQTVVEKAGYSVIRDLTGHGIGKSLHEDPFIPCYADPRTRDEILKPGQALAVEVMYAMGDYRLKLDSDGWTLSTTDGSLAAMFEETVFLTETGQEILTV